LGYKIDAQTGIREGYSCKLFVADRAFYIKLFSNLATSTRYFSCNYDGNIEKEISKTEFELWLTILADTDKEIAQIQESLSAEKKY
jgi:hypothetical protein